MPETARAVAARSAIELPDAGAALYQPDLNIRLGVRYLRELLDCLQSPAAAVAAYNAGLGQVTLARLAGQPADLFLPLEIHFRSDPRLRGPRDGQHAAHRLVHPELARPRPPPPGALIGHCLLARL